MRTPLLAWFERHGRALPWRRPAPPLPGAPRRDPYRVWVAEVMLQQTRVDSVVPYFERWMERFPDVASLAAASEDDVLRLWQGLGYYRRALRLHAAARRVQREHDGVLPATPEALEALPGVGRYTAAAVAALAYGADVVAIDGNVRRVAARLFGWRRLPAERVVEAELAEMLGTRPVGTPPEATPGERGRPARAATGATEGPRPPRHGPAIAEALIELGALVCTPRTPRCPACPLRPACRAAAGGAPEHFPEARPRPAPPRRRRFALVALEDRRVWLRRRRDDEMLAGLWGFPQSEEAPAGARSLGSVAHAYSHFRLELEVTLVAPTHPALAAVGDAQPRGLDELAGLALSRVDEHVLERLREAELVGEAAVS